MIKEKCAEKTMFGITEIGEQRRYHSKNLSEHSPSILGENKNRG